MSEFDKHWNEWVIASNCPEDEAKIHFEAGQQSKQAEIDALKAKIDGAIKYLSRGVYTPNWLVKEILK